MFKTIKYILERHLQILEYELERIKNRDLEAEYIYEDFKEIAEITYRHPFGAETIKALVEGCVDFIDIHGPFNSENRQINSFLKETITIENYRKWLRSQYKQGEI